jgi:hypothetical protein
MDGLATPEAEDLVEAFGDTAPKACELGRKTATNNGNRKRGGMRIVKRSLFLKSDVYFGLTWGAKSV